MSDRPLVIVLAGGGSPEREVSLRSAQAVNTALQEAGYSTQVLDPRDEIEELDKFEINKAIVFPILHGAGGEDGEIQTLLERKGFKYLGSDSKASKVAFDKWLTREVLRHNNLPIAKGSKVTKDTYWNNQLVKTSHVLKVVQGGSSLGTLIVDNPGQQSHEAVDMVFTYGRDAVIEELVEGVEVTISILDDKALPVIEIVPPPEGFDYENKYNGKTQEICPPRSLDDSIQARLKELAEQTHAAVGCRHLSRVDMIVQPNGEPVILEINTIPGMTDQSLYPLSARNAGYSFPNLMKEFVKLVQR